MVERWFAALTEKQIRRGAHRSVRELETAIKTYLAISNESPKPSPGPRAPTRFSLPSPAFVSGLQIQDTSIEGYNWARSESDFVKNVEWAKTFRSLLGKSTVQNNHMYWTDLWAAEFRLAPKSDYAELRAQVAEDLSRLERMPEPWSRSMMADIATGYRLTKRPEAAEEIEKRLDPNGEAHKADQAFMKEGWDSATAVSQVPAKPASTAKPAVTTAYKVAPWNSVNKAMNEMNLRDVAGRTWTLADIRGKMTLVTAWATWCGPCRGELPSVQKLYELAKTRNDIQVITLNFDEDPGLVEPFLAACHYTFPVLMSARDYAASHVAGELGIPQNWLVDHTLILSEKSIGFDSMIPDWPKAMLDKLNPSRQ